MYFDQLRSVSSFKLCKVLAPFIKIWGRIAISSALVMIAWTLTTLFGYGDVALSQTAIIGDTQPTVQIMERSADLNGCGGDILPSSNPEFEARVVQLINRIRLENGLLPLKRVTALENASRFHATDMATEDYFSHTSYDRVNSQLVESCAWSNRIQRYYNNYNLLAENIAAGFTTPEAVVDGWMNSSGHRNNILNGEIWEIGVGYYTGVGSYRHYWVQDFGRSRDVYPLVINSDATATDTGELTLHMYGDWQSVRFRHNDGPWSDWQPFQAALSTRIEGDAGLYTIHAELRKDDRTVTSSASIYLTQSNRPAKLSTLPEEIAFVYLRSEQRFTPDFFGFHPLATADDSYRWVASVDKNWLMVSPTQGDDTDLVEIYPSVTSAGDIAPGTATVTFVLLNAQGVAIDSHTMSASLQVVDGSLSQIYLPALQR